MLRVKTVRQGPFLWQAEIWCMLKVRTKEHSFVFIIKTLVVFFNDQDYLMVIYLFISKDYYSDLNN